MGHCPGASGRCNEDGMLTQERASGHRFGNRSSINPVSLAMVNSINQVGHVMGMEIIAAFVENEQILDKLRAIGVNYAQGYGIGKPRPLAEMAT